MSDKDDEIIPREHCQPFRCEVINLADVRVRFGKPKTPNKCNHKDLVYDFSEKRVWCKECEKSIENFDAFMVLVDNFTAMIKEIKRKSFEVTEALKHNIISRAAKKIDEAWRRKSTVPCCPHCKGALLPEDFENGVYQSSKALEIARRNKKKPA